MMIIDGYCTLGDERETDCSAAELVGELDRAGIDKAVVAPQDREFVCLNESGNDRIAGECRRQPERLIPACTVNPWFGSEALGVLRKAVDRGARMLCLAPALQGFILGDELCDSAMEWAGSIRLPIYVHTGCHAYSIPAQLLLVAERFPETRFICGHCGSTDYAREMDPLMERRQENIWYELSFVRPWCLPAYLSRAGADRLVFGSSSPRNRPGFELEQFARVLPLDKYPQVYGENLAGLMQEVIT